MVVSARGTFTASPAKLVFTQGARHVVAASILLNACATQRAKGDVALILLYPTKKLFRHGFLTRFRAMPKVSTLKAYFSLASWARQMYIILIFGPDVGLTARFRAPTHHFVPI